MSDKTRTAGPHEIVLDCEAFDQLRKQHSSMVESLQELCGLLEAIHTVHAQELWLGSEYSKAKQLLKDLEG